MPMVLSTVAPIPLPVLSFFTFYHIVIIHFVVFKLFYFTFACVCIDSIGDC